MGAQTLEALVHASFEQLSMKEDESRHARSHGQRSSGRCRRAGVRFLSSLLPSNPHHHLHHAPPEPLDGGVKDACSVRAALVSALHHSDVGPAQHQGPLGQKKTTEEEEEEVHVP